MVVDNEQVVDILNLLEASPQSLNDSSCMCLTTLSAVPAHMACPDHMGKKAEQSHRIETSCFPFMTILLLVC